MSATGPAASSVRRTGASLASCGFSVDVAFDSMMFPYVKLANKQSALDGFVLPVEIAGFDHEAGGVGQRSGREQRTSADCNR